MNLAKYDDEYDLLIWSDDGGHVNILKFNKRFFLDNVTEDRPALVDFMHLFKKEYQEKYHMTFQKVRIYLLELLLCKKYYSLTQTRPFS